MRVRNEARETKKEAFDELSSHRRKEVESHQRFCVFSFNAPAPPLANAAAAAVCWPRATLQGAKEDIEKERKR
jgi:hypothetical protein